jgi:uncharacterized Zn finger protein (UPF0148 family)
MSRAGLRCRCGFQLRISHNAYVMGRWRCPICGHSLGEGFAEQLWETEKQQRAVERQRRRQEWDRERERMMRAHLNRSETQRRRRDRENAEWLRPLPQGAIAAKMKRR